MRNLLFAAMALLAASPAWSGEARDCADPSVLGRIQARFGYQVRHVPNLPDVRIDGFRKVHQHRYLPARDNRPIARRYCGATAALSNGRDRYVWYLIENPMGFAGHGSNVEFCVTGFDRWYVYSGRCRVLR